MRFVRRPNLSLQGRTDLAKIGRELGAHALNCGDDSEGYTCCHQSVFDGGLRRSHRLEMRGRFFFIGCTFPIDWRARSVLSWGGRGARKVKLR